MNYTLHQLIIFLKIVELKSVTKASEELNMTQPSVSIQLKNFQDQFKLPLTELISRRIYITEFGYEIAEIAKKILSETEALAFKTKEYEGLLAGKIRISSASTGKYIVPYFISDFFTIHEGVDLVLDVTNRSQVLASLKNLEIDFAVISILPEDIELEGIDLVENYLYLMGAKNKELPLDHLIFREEGSATRNIMQEYFGEGRMGNRKKLELTSNEAVKQAVIAGLGNSILPIVGLKHELIEGTIKIIPNKKLPIKTQWKLVWLKERKHTPASKQFIEFIRKNAPKVRQDNFSWIEKYANQSDF